jgi:periplasmic glucans biosynthesis protein
MNIALRSGLRMLAACAAAMSIGIAAAQPRFDFAAVEREAQALAGAPYKAEPRRAIPPALAKLDYDTYRAVSFKPEHTLWRDAGGMFRAQFFPAGFLYASPVEINVVHETGVAPVTASGAMFDWGKLPEAERPAEVPLAGFRLLYPLHRPDVDDEIASFLGASYFRILARGQRYGISARGIAIDTGLPKQEEFPRFTRFWLVAPDPKAQSITVYALLDSPGLAGAFAFELRPGTRRRWRSAPPCSPVTGSRGWALRR